MNRFTKTNKFNKFSHWIHSTKDITNSNKHPMFKATKNRLSTIHGMSGIKYEAEEKETLLKFLRRLSNGSS